MTQSLWRDEAFSYFLAKNGIFRIMGLTAGDFNPPLYYVLLHYWMLIFGKSEIALRSLSLIFFAIAVYFAFLFLQNVLVIQGKRLWMYVVAFAFNPALLYFAFEARMYSLFAFLSLMSFYFFATKKRKEYIITSTLGLYTHYFFIFVVFTQLLYILFYKKKRERNYRAILLPLLFFAPWFLLVVRNLVKGTSEFWIGKTNWTDIVSSLGVLFTGYERIDSPYYIPIIVISLFFAALCIYFLARKAKRNDAVLPLLMLWSFLAYMIILIVSLFKPLYVFRYVIFACVGFNMLLFYVSEHLTHKMRTYLFIILFISILFFNQVQIKQKRKGSIRSTIREITSIAKEGDVIYVTDPKLFFTISYYFDEKRVFLFGEKSTSIPRYVGAVLIPPEKTISTLPQYPQKAFILYEENRYEIQAIQ